LAIAITDADIPIAINNQNSMELREYPRWVFELTLNATSSEKGRISRTAKANEKLMTANHFTIHFYAHNRGIAALCSDP
jgi:hypothetical protein